MELLTVENQKILHQIKYFYGLNEDSNHLLKIFFSSNENKIWDLQLALANHILCDKSLLTYQPYRKYRRMFLKTIIDSIEKLQEEVNEKVLESYITLINEAYDSGEEKYFLVVFPKVFYADIRFYLNCENYWRKLSNISLIFPRKMMF